MHQSVTLRGWLVASSLGLAIGIPGGLVLGAPLEVIVGAMLVTPTMLGLSGLFLGTSQWLALRRSLDHSAQWIGLTVVGLGTGLTLAVIAVEQGGALLTGTPVRLSSTGTGGLFLSVLVLGLLGGPILGLAQSHALRQYQRARIRWAAASTVGLTLGFVSGVTASLPIGGMTSGPGLIAFLSVSGLVYSAITRRELRTLLT